MRQGRFGYDYIHHPHRLTKPLIRRDDAPAKGLNVDPANWQEVFREASWDEALDLPHMVWRNCAMIKVDAALRDLVQRSVPTKRRICSKNDPSGIWAQ